MRVKPAAREARPRIETMFFSVIIFSDCPQPIPAAASRTSFQRMVTPVVSTQRVRDGFKEFLRVNRPGGMAGVSFFPTLVKSWLMVKSSGRAFPRWSIRAPASYG